MKPEIEPTLLIQQAGKLLGQPLVAWHAAPHGADHLVLLATADDGRRVVIKAGAEAHVDAHVLERLQAVRAKVPQVLAQAPIEGDTGSLVVMAHVGGRLLAEVAPPRHRYLPSLMIEMQRVHRITRIEGAGPAMEVVAGGRRTWKEYLLDVLTGTDSEFHWSEIQRTPSLDRGVLTAGIEWLTERVGRLPEPEQYSLLHGDLNPYNVFVDQHEVVGIIDWSYARFGDPLFDFARLRMNPFVRADPATLERYFEILQLNAAERERERTYYLFNLLEYVNWYYLDGDLERALGQLALIEAELAG